MTVVKTSNKKLKEAKEKGKKSVSITKHGVVEMYWYENSCYMTNMIDFDGIELEYVAKNKNTEKPEVKKKERTLRDMLDKIIFENAENYGHNEQIIVLPKVLQKFISEEVMNYTGIAITSDTLHYSNGAGSIKIKFI